MKRKETLDKVVKATQIVQERMKEIAKEIQEEREKAEREQGQGEET